MNRALAEQALVSVLQELGEWSYERLRSLRSERLSRELNVGGELATVHADVLEEFTENKIEKLLVPVEIWIGKEVVWAHLVARSDGAHEIDMRVHTNPAS